MQYSKEISNQCDQEKVRKYCLHRELIKPNTNILIFVCWLLLLEIMVACLSVGVDCLFDWFDISFSFSILHFLTGIVVFFIFLKRICILLIELYQHYASENTRRKCTLMPSCSEYALLALQKYNIIKSLYKIYKRLATKCNGSYQVDYP